MVDQEEMFFRDILLTLEVGILPKKTIKNIKNEMDDLLPFENPTKVYKKLQDTIPHEFLNVKNNQKSLGLGNSPRSDLKLKRRIPKLVYQSERAHRDCLVDQPLHKMPKAGDVEAIISRSGVHLKIKNQCTLRQLPTDDGEFACAKSR